MDFWITLLKDYPMPILITVLFYLLLKKDIRNLETKMEHFKELLKPIKEALSNHVTETDKKIDNLNKDVKENRKEIKEDIKENRKEMKEGHTRLEHKLDKLLDKK